MKLKRIPKWAMDIKLDPLTRYFLQSLNDDEIVRLESNICHRCHGKSFTRLEFTWKVIDILKKQFLIEDESKFFDDSDYGKTQVVSDFEQSFFNSVLSLVDFEKVADAITEVMWVEGKASYLRTYWKLTYPK
jgi:hypothetical protein